MTSIRKALEGVVAGNSVRIGGWTEGAFGGSGVRWLEGDRLYIMAKSADVDQNGNGIKTVKNNSCRHWCHNSGV